MRKPFTVILLALSISWLSFSQETVTRSFQLERISTEQATSVITDLLGPEGSVSVRPARRELIIQDRPEIVAAIAKVIEQLDADVISYRLEIELIRATTPREGSEEVNDPVDRGVVRMFPFKVFKSLGKTTVEGTAGSEMQTRFAGFRLSFETGAELERRRHTPSVGRDPVFWLLQLEDVRLVEEARSDVEILRTHITVAEGQSVHIAASASETSETALVLVIRAHKVGAGGTGD